MTGKKDFRALEKRLVRLGFEFDHANAHSQYVYTHPDHPDLAVSPGINDHAARHLLCRVEKALGAQGKAAKRNAAAVKERQAHERERHAAELARLDAEREDIIRRRDDLLDGAGARLSNGDLHALEARVREIESQRREIERLMHSPVGGSHQGDRRARHEGGQR